MAKPIEQEQSESGVIARARSLRKRISNRTFGWFIFAFLALVWGSSFILIKRGLDAFTPTQVAGLRLFVAGLVLLPFSIGQAYRIYRREWKFIFLVGLFGNAIPAFLFPLAETHINSATTGILNVLSPLFAMIFGFLLFHGKFSMLKVVGVFFGLAGSVLLIVMGDHEIDLQSQIIYSLYAVLATACYGFTVNIMKTHLDKTPSHLASAFALQMMAIPYAFILLGSGILEVFRTNPDAWASLGYVSILGAIGTALGLVLFYKLVQMTDAVVSASVTYLIPIVAVGWGLLDGETVNAWQWLGMAIILSGVWLVNRKSAQPAS